MCQPRAVARLGTFTLLLPSLPEGWGCEEIRGSTHAPTLTDDIPSPIPQRHNRAWLDQPQPRHGCADHVSDVARCQMGIVLFGHTRVGMAEVCRDYL